MTQHESLIQYAYDRNIFVINYKMLSFPSCAMEVEGIYDVTLDLAQLQTTPEQCVALGHELGHIETRSLNQMGGRYDAIGHNEHRAWAWAVQRLLPQNKLEDALHECGGRLWEVAELLEVTQEFVERALAYYQTIQ